MFIHYIVLITAFLVPTFIGIWITAQAVRTKKTFWKIMLVLHVLILMGILTYSVSTQTFQTKCLKYNPTAIYHKGATIPEVGQVCVKWGNE